MRSFCQGFVDSAPPTSKRALLNWLDGITRRRQQAAVSVEGYAVGDSRRGPDQELQPRASIYPSSPGVTASFFACCSVAPRSVGSPNISGTQKSSLWLVLLASPFSSSCRLFKVALSVLPSILPRQRSASPSRSSERVEAGRAPHLVWPRPSLLLTRMRHRKSPLTTWASSPLRSLKSISQPLMAMVCSRYTLRASPECHLNNLLPPNLPSPRHVSSSDDRGGH